MEDESDYLISVTLKQSGWNGNVSPVAAMPASELVEMVTWGFAQIRQDKQLQSQEPFKFEYPKGVAQRHRLAASLAEQFKAMGYTGECGYNHLLYPTESDTKRMLLWLIQKLPRVEKEVHDIDVPRIQYRSRMRVSLQKWMDQSSSPQQTTRCRNINRSSILPVSWLENDTNPARRKYIASKQPLITDSKLCQGQTQRSLLEVNALSLSHDTSRYGLFDTTDLDDDKSTLKATLQSAFSTLSIVDRVPSAQSKNQGVFDLSPLNAPLTSTTNNEPLPSAAVASPDATQIDRREDELQAMHAELAQLRDEYTTNETTIHELMATIEARHAIKYNALRELEQETTIRQQTLDMLSDASNNIAKLQSMCAKSSDRLVQLAEEWETHRLPLVQKLDAHESEQLQRQERAAAMVNEMQTYRIEMKQMVETLGQKQEQREERIATCTRHALDIIKQVHKQKAEIDKIVKDIRSVQKQINISSEKLKRSEAIAEERLFHAAKDETHRPEKKQMYVECYRLFTTVRELFDELITCVAECGKRENQSRDLEIWISQMTHRVNMSNLDRIRHDMAQVQEENQALMQEIQTLTLERP
ncbi:hypothetical protein LEN26_007718 [Aphanomyces euteiches]|nr:hypothetical protein LEN26_007718 [Aphanomyces euteiches]